MRGFDWLSGGITVVVHLLLALLCMFIAIERPEVAKESGLPVIMGGIDTDYNYTDVQSVAASSVSPQREVNSAPSEPIISQSVEESVSLDEGNNSATKREEQRTPTEAELRAEAERRAQEEADKLLMNLFSQETVGGESSADVTESGSANALGLQEGNSTQGVMAQTPSYGTWDLGGRDIIGSLPRPSYDDVQAEGRVVVNITVNNEGNVVSVSINPRTNTINKKLQESALQAARRTKFSTVGGLNNQSGTITYYFKQR